MQSTTSSSKKTQDKKRCNTAQMTSTVKLVKSFFEQPLHDSVPDEFQIDEQIIWPDERIFPAKLKQIFQFWTVEDDFLAIASYNHKAAFFCDPVWRDLMLQRINKLDFVTRNNIDSKIPFSSTELAILESIPSTSETDIHFFLDCLCKTDEFGTRRSAVDLQKKWETFRNQQMLDDEVEMAKPDDSNAQKDKNFVSKCRENFADYKLEFAAEDFELPYPEGMQNEDECQHLASLRYGDYVFTLEMPMTIIGCRSASFEPDIDLSVFGESEKIEAKQVALEYDESGQYILRNLGHFPVLINGAIVIQENNEIILPSKCEIKFDRISLVFRVSGSSMSKLTLDWDLIDTEN